MPPSLSNFLPFTSTLLHVWWLSPSWVEKLICELSSSFSILWPLNEGSAVSVSALILLLAVWIWAEKDPPWPRQEVSAWARTLARVQATNLVTKVGVSVAVILWIAQNIERIIPQVIKNYYLIQQTCAWHQWGTSEVLTCFHCFTFGLM